MTLSERNDSLMNKLMKLPSKNLSRLDVPDQNYTKSAILLSKAFYMLDHKAIAFKLECEPEYLLTFLEKKEVEVRIEAISLLHKLCANKEIQ